MNLRLLILVGMLAASMGRTAEPLPDRLDAYQTQYRSNAAELEADRDREVQTALESYRRELTTLLASVRQQGDLDYVVAVQKELARTETDHSAPKEPAAKRMKQLRQAQWAARQAEDKANESRDRAAATLRTSYLKSLRALEKRLVAGNRIEEAKQARAEGERLDAMEAICGNWFWVGKYPRKVTLDGKIWDLPIPKQCGTWTYEGTLPDGRRQYRTVMNDGKYIDMVAMSKDGTMLEWFADQGRKRYTATREPSN